MRERLETLAIQFQLPYRLRGFKINCQWFATRVSLAGVILAMLLPQLLLSITVGQEASPTSVRNDGSKFHVEEATVADIHRAFRSGDLTAVQLVDIFRKRIAELDAPNDLKAFVVLNEMASARARELDREFKETGRLRPLHGIPVAVKDNYDTHDLQTAGGSIALAGSLG